MSTISSFINTVLALFLTALLIIFPTAKFPFLSKKNCIDVGVLVLTWILFPEDTVNIACSLLDPNPTTSYLIVPVYVETGSLFKVMLSLYFLPANETFEFPSNTRLPFLITISPASIVIVPVTLSPDLDTLFFISSSYLVPSTLVPKRLSVCILV